MSPASGDGFDFSGYTSSYSSPTPDPAYSFNGRESPVALVPAGPPYPLLWGSLGIAAGGAVLGVLALLFPGWNPVLGVIGWFVSGPFAIGAFAVFTYLDLKESAKPMYGIQKLPVWVTRIGLVVALAGVVLSSLGVAFWAGHP